MEYIRVEIERNKKKTAAHNEEIMKRALYWWKTRGKYPTHNVDHQTHQIKFYITISNSEFH